MKLKWMGAVLALTLLSACGEGEKPAEAKGADAGKASGAVGETQTDAGKTDDGQDKPQNTGAVQKGYLFAYKGTKVSVDEDMTIVLEGLGEALDYFEAASCAFEGLDKVYTYSDFEIDTYPQGDQDLVSAIILKSDVVTTAEGVYVGSSFAEVTAAYGTDYSEEAGMVVYRKDGMKLCFIVQNDEVISIQYLSTVLDE